jgi:hypothetical protein
VDKIWMRRSIESPGGFALIGAARVFRDPFKMANRSAGILVSFLWVSIFKADKNVGAPET